MVRAPLQHVMGGEVFARVSKRSETQVFGQAMFLYLAAISSRRGYSSDPGIWSIPNCCPEARTVGQAEAAHTESGYPRPYPIAGSRFAVGKVGATR